MKKAVILFSGGLDSTTCLAHALHEGFTCHALSFNYGQKHATEIVAAKKIAAAYGVSHTIIDIPLWQLAECALTNPNIAVPDFKDHHTIPITYVPARNTLFLSFGLALAESINAKDIFIGVSAVDYSGYPDCRPEYIAAFQNLANLATKMGVHENNIKIHTPLIHLSKAETILLGLSLGVDYEATISCYRATANGHACGTCDSCVLRKKGFREANIKDPTSY
jgi:7-cyano-7-deazaguanine synthase